MSLRSAMLFAPSAFAASLGVWQVQRLSGKRDEIAYRESLLGGEPLDLNDKLGSACFKKHAPVTCRGRFLHDRSIYVGPRVRSELGQTFQGCMLVTPLELDSPEGTPAEPAPRRRRFSLFSTTAKAGSAPEPEPERCGSRGNRTVLVLRGWIPQKWKDNPSRFDFERPSGLVQVEGLVKPSDKPGFFAPQNLPEIGQWFYYDVPAMARACGLGEPAAASGSGEDDVVLIEEVVLGQSSETKRVKLSTAMDVLAFRTDRNLWRGGDGPAASAEGGVADRRADADIVTLMNKLNTSTLPIRRTLGDFLRFNVTPQDHINYALTWFTLSLCTALMAYARLRSSQTGRNWWYFTKRRKGLPS